MFERRPGSCLFRSYKNPFGCDREEVGDAKVIRPSCEINAQNIICRRQCVNIYLRLVCCPSEGVNANAQVVMSVECP